MAKPPSIVLLQYSKLDFTIAPKAAKNESVDQRQEFDFLHFPLDVRLRMTSSFEFPRMQNVRPWRSTRKKTWDDGIIGLDKQGEKTNSPAMENEFIFVFTISISYIWKHFSWPCMSALWHGRKKFSWRKWKLCIWLQWNTDKWITGKVDQRMNWIKNMGQKTFLCTFYPIR